MKASYGEGLAIQAASESCVFARKGKGEALMGVRAGWVLSRMNGRVLSLFRYRVAWLWYRALNRRSQKSRLTWERMQRLINRWLPPARICHPYPLRRLGVIT